MNLAKTVSNIKKYGPTRVMVGDHRADSTENAMLLGIFPEIVYIREDGWSLGCNPRTEAVARDMWEWVARLDLKDYRVELIGRD